MRTIEEILSAGDYISGETISRELNITRAAVWKRIEALRAEGWEIESGGKRGYRLIAGDSLQPALWQGRLRTQALGRGEVHYAVSVDSTNSEVKRMAVGPGSLSSSGWYLFVPSGYFRADNDPDILVRIDMDGSNYSGTSSYRRISGEPNW